MKKLLAIILIGLAPAILAQSQSKVTFVQRSGTTYVFEFKGNTIRTTCDWTSYVGPDGVTEKKKSRGFCPLGLLPGGTLTDFSTVEEGDCAPNSGRRTWARVDSEAVLVGTERCTEGTNGNWIWQEFGPQIWFDVNNVKQTGVK